ncbi:SAM-dependent methyltransferase [Paenibacillus sp. PK3_47]|uniref:class I SAM-dependent methyltransferase n=1 Tax=Paenibacillus sp. PK3_47 TaxID=2072642 RepID=UPI00201E729C|nr:class I SAM-dependent methyltransferase [Paenibacillus sp. PK3_47]UQZ36034.1 SAM-dependent methyltransferase [Paenibacillus sp. PK3_47]
MSRYWSERFSKEGMIWGSEASPSAFWAKDRFREAGVTSVLIPGAGYGRNTKVFSSDFTAYGVELSLPALELAAEWDPLTVFIAGSALEIQLADTIDAVYCYDVLHLFLAEERRRLIEASLAQLRPGGLLYFTVFSDEDSNNGRGTMLERGTYEYKEGKYAHFFSEADLREHFADTEILETGSWTERLHSRHNGIHQYILRYLLARTK